MKTQSIRNLAQDQSSVLEEISGKTMDSKVPCLEESLFGAMRLAVPNQAAPIVQQGDKLAENFCASIIQLDPNIYSVTRTTDHSLENAQRCQYEDEYMSVNEELDQLRFLVRDLTERYQYELTSNRSYHQLTFHMNPGHLTVLVNNLNVDVVTLADRIAELVYRSQTMSAITREEHLSSQPDLGSATLALHHTVVSQF